ncbi:MAG: AAA family ATPase [Flavobacteriales bacterium]|nr:AAA family ATPase [Flavobacteriales bacterium]
MKSPYISRVRIVNFRNFKEIDVELNHKEVLIGENGVGKTNFLKAIQLILDPTLSEFDRQLNESDFNDSVENPYDNGEEITISIEIRNYEHKRGLIAQFQDAVVSVTPPTLRFTYKHFPKRDETGQIVDYTYKIFKGNDEEKSFGRIDREYLNIYVIKALRDVERELKANKRSPLYRLVERYRIDKDKLDEISEEMQTAADEIFNLDEIKDIKTSLEEKFKTLAGLQYDNSVELRPYDIDSERLLYSIQVYMGIKERPVSELSLGLTNILYIALMLLLTKDGTIPRVIKKTDFENLSEEDENHILPGTYDISTSEENYILKDGIASDTLEELYRFFDRNNNIYESTTILAVEEPEAHLHPVLQRLIYREVLQKSQSSVIFTTHSPYITSVTPLNSIVYGKFEGDHSKLFSSSTLNLTPNDRNDLERYIDSKRGEIYFGKGVLLVEGITEEFIMPKVADLLNSPLDDLGIVICNVHSTNFKPYIRLLNALSIPWAVVTDGDYYQIFRTEDENGEEKVAKLYHRMHQDGVEHSYRGVELMNKTIIDLEVTRQEDIPDNIEEQYNHLLSLGFHIGTYTFEVDSMIKGSDAGKLVLKNVYSQVRDGGEKQQENFDTELDNNNYWSALKKIESNISKGRFAQRLADQLTLDMIPEYLVNAVSDIVHRVKGEE